MAKKYIKHLNKETLSLVKNDVLASFEVAEIRGMSFDDFFSEVDVQNAYEEEWEPVMYKPYYLEVYNQITKNKTIKSNPTQFYNAWIPLTKEEFDHEWDSENIVFFFSSAYNKKADEQEWRDTMFEMLPKISSVQKITKDQLNPRNPDYYVADDLDDLKSKLAYMAPPKDVFGLAKSFRSNKPLYMPMIVKDGDTYKTISGRTRMGVAFLMNYAVKAIVIDKAKLMNLVILPIQRHKYLNSGSLFVKSPNTKQKILDYVDGIISKKELMEDKELSHLDEDKLKFETDMAKRYSFRPQTKNNPVKKEELKLLASAPSLDEIKKLIAQYCYNKPEKIILTPIDESHWSIFQIGDIDYLDKMKRQHENGLIKMDKKFVELKKGRYRFLSIIETKSNPRKGPREYGTRDGGKLNLSQALEIRANDYRTRNAQHDYDPESVDRRIYELQSSQTAMRIAKSHRVARVEHFKIKVKWQLYKSLIGHYVYLELPDFPFYNVKLMEDKKQFIVESGTGTKTQNIKYFSNLPDAIDYAEEEFLKLCSQDENYIVSIASGM